MLNMSAQEDMDTGKWNNNIELMYLLKCVNANERRSSMATISMNKEFVVKEEKTFEQFKKDVEKKANLNRAVESDPSLEKGTEKLIRFSFL